MKLLTLISDWKLRDPYIGMVKGELCKAFPDAHIIDITHAVEPGNVPQTAFLLRNAFTSFPERTLHLILTGTTGSCNANPVLMPYRNHYFMGADNGIFSLITENEPIERAWICPTPSSEISIPHRMIQMARWLYDQKLDGKAEEYTTFNKKTAPYPDYNFIANSLKGQIVYIDSNCNAVTNISSSLFREYVGNKKFSATLGSRKQLKVHKFYERYQPNEFDIYLTVNRLEFIEITINGGALAVLASLQVGDAVEINIL
ncbi:MAG: SAM-dependent chlorinase/fluorinase [Tannerella sp.]|jgi:S-adenosylmethionine hydrolase|nr:SAM-dependent chlorinase/fluorinase [Tannerella sp.]